MSSGVICTISLDPCHQQFLWTQFHEQNPDKSFPFRFPKKHDLTTWLNMAYTPAPKNVKNRNFVERAFHIEVPYQEHKNPMVYNFLSDAKQQKFRSRVREYFEEIITDEIRKMKKEGLKRDEIVLFILEDFKIDDKYSDRVIRAYSRYMAAERQRRFRRKLETV